VGRVVDRLIFDVEVHSSPWCRPLHRDRGRSTEG
jgi:hypothetical protein